MKNSDGKPVLNRFSIFFYIQEDLKKFSRIVLSYNERGDDMSEIIDKYHFIKHCEDIICSIKDVVSAKIVTTPDDKISEIHVIANSKRNPKQIVRDIESALIATLGSEVDHKKISVAQISDDNCYSKEARLKIDSIRLSKSRLNYEAIVSLSDDGNIFEGKSVSSASSGLRMKTVGMAAVDAVNKYTGDMIAMTLEDLITFKIGGKEAVCVLITLVLDRNEEHLLGCSLIKQDSAEAVVAAVLNAVNRRISFLVKERDNAN